MKLSKIAVCLAAFACLSFSSLQASVLIDFGETTFGGTPYWNGIGQLTNNSTSNLKNNTGDASPIYTLKYKGAGAVSIPSIATEITNGLAKLTYAKSVWKTTYGHDVIDAQLRTAIGGISSIASDRKSIYTLGGLTAGHTYSLSLFVYSKALLGGDVAKLSFSGGDNVTIKNYKESAPSAIVLNSNEVSLSQGGDQMITIEFTATIGGNAELQFVTPKGNTNATAIQAMICKDTTRSVPEASTAMLTVLGLGSLVIRRRRKA